MKLSSITKKVLSVFTVSVLLLVTQSVMALPKAFQANYTVKKGSMTLGNLHTSLKYSGNNYSYHKYTKATGFAALLTGIKITENTDGKVAGQIITPTNYFFNQSKRGGGKVDKVNFSRSTASGSYKKEPFKIKTPHGVQDKASMELLLARDLSNNKSRLSYNIVSHGETSQYNFQKLGHEVLKTPAGTFNTIKVKVVRSGNERETVFWMAKELDYMPAKIRHRENKDVISTVIKNYKKL
ncbi:MAG: DUF3108 domain-containing protein [Cocleimonas sp.]